MQKQFYFLSPVEVVRVTMQNLAEVAEWCGGKVASTESRIVPGRMDSYVWVPTPKASVLSTAFPGMFITKRLVLTVKNELRVTYAVFRRDYFEKNYFESPAAAVDATWDRDAKKSEKKAMAPMPTPADVAQKAPINITVNVTGPVSPEQAQEIAEQVAAATTQEEIPTAEEALEMVTEAAQTN